MSIKKWHEVAVSADEYAFFIGKDKKSGLVRSSYDFRSVAAIAKESGLTKDKVEALVDKFMKMGIVVQSPNKEDHYGYWDRVSPNLGKTQTASLSEADKAKRVGAAKAKNP